ncbi:MAG: bifunctional diaminohydroxyphosphoribosylaminopyrimidine deaminase/5-amino-6-(5-phosphoribosylamino)uracil reductase RibD [Phycisphaerales bacterium]|nr:bifunctional diaminohydroxyphosphoribosylaminopyrimidine deaminase/5-amino-6-(5-phosphoribosylamino)uracil reductase RibD [Phycisphaerales bacterium]
MNDLDTRMLRRAARLALRGHGGAEPNPLVGCIVLNASGNVVGSGFHARCGAAHAERHALDRAGDAARGGTVYTTLEPCTHHGRTPPCTDAIIGAGVARVVAGGRDPNPLAEGGIEALQAAGIRTDVRDDVPEVRWLNAPFLHRLEHHRPWVLAKWAQTLDGRIATSTGDSRWISSARSRRLVHRERGRVDAILTGIGTVLADDPRLDPREVRVRRTPTRVVFDPDLDTPLDSNLMKTAGELPLVLACKPAHLDSPRGQRLAEAGATLHALATTNPLEDLLVGLAADHDISTVMVEAGGGLLGRLLAADLVDAALVFTAPRLLGDREAPGPVRGLAPASIAETARFELVFAGRRDEDLLGWYHRPTTARPE